MDLSLSLSFSPFLSIFFYLSLSLSLDRRWSRRNLLDVTWEAEVNRILFYGRAHVSVRVLANVYSRLIFRILAALEPFLLRFDL